MIKLYTIFKQVKQKQGGSEMKVYQAVAYGGQYDDAYEVILGTFLEKEKAEKVIENIKGDKTHGHYGFYISEFKVIDSALQNLK